MTNAASDIDCPPNEMTYTLENPPEGASIDSNGVITWTPTEAQGPGAYTIKTIVTDYNPLALINQRLSATNTFQLVINEINIAPSLVLADIAINEMTPLSISASATDPDIPTNALTYELVSGPPGLTVSPEGAIAWLPGEADGPAVYPVTVRVTDSNPDAVNEQHLSTTNTFNVSVREVNTAPVLASLQDRAVNPGQPIQFTATATDADVPTNPLAFSLVNPPAGAVIGPDSGEFEWRPPVALADSTNLLQVRVTDWSPDAVNAQELSDTQSFTVVVAPLTPVRLTPLSLTGGAFQVEVSGMVGPDYVLQAAEGLTTWTNVGTNTPAVLPFVFTDPEAGVFSNRFYRVLLRP